MGTTPVLALPYPEGTDPVGQGDNDMHAIGTRLDTVLGGRNQPNGFAGLDAGGKVPAAQLPPATSATTTVAFSPLDYGAVGNGTTNDYNALAATFTAAAGKGYVDLGGKTYKFDSRLIVPAGTDVRNGGLSSSVATTGDQGAIDVNAGDAHFTDIDFIFTSTPRFGVFADQPGAKNITIHGGTGTGCSSHVFCFNDKVTDSEIIGVTLSNVVYGIRLRGALQRVKANNNVITQWLSYGIEVRGVSGVGAPSVVETNGNIGSNPTGGDPSVVTGRAGQLIRYLGASDAITTDAQNDRNICVGPSLAFNPGTNNNATGDQIGMQFVDRFTCNDNTMREGGENGISITDAMSNGEVAGNTVSGCDGHGIQVSRLANTSTNVLVHHNLCYNNAQNRAGNNGGNCAGIYIQDSTSCSVYNNRCFDNGTPKKQTNGILVSTATDLSLWGNDLAGNLTARLAEQGTRTYKRKEDGDTLTHGDGAGAPILRINGATSQRREIRWQTAGVDRWRMIVSASPEAGSDVGSAFVLDRISDDGTVVNNAMTIDRASGLVTFPGGISGISAGPGVYSVASTASLAVDATLYAKAKITAQAAALTIANPTGTPSAMQGLVYRVKDNGTARTIGYGSQFRAVGVTLPTTTTVSKTLYLGCMWNSDDTKWDVIAVGAEA